MIIILVTPNIMISVTPILGFLRDHWGLNAEGVMPITELFLLPQKPVGINSFPFCCWRKYIVDMIGVKNTLLNNQEF